MKRTSKETGTYRVEIRNPDGVRGAGRGMVPVWMCPACGKLKTLLAFGLRKRDDIRKPPPHVWQIQSQCGKCR
jgi:hypothetical protein